MAYRLTKVQSTMGEANFADSKICNEQDEPIVTFGFAGEHEASIGRALMIRAITNAVVIVGHTSIARSNRNSFSTLTLEYCCTVIMTLEYCCTVIMNL